jgi:hypothetical protein
VSLAYLISLADDTWQETAERCGVATELIKLSKK